jgi:hypothetical protein
VKEGGGRKEGRKEGRNGAERRKEGRGRKRKEAEGSGGWKWRKEVKEAEAGRKKVEEGKKLEEGEEGRKEGRNEVELTALSEVGDHAHPIPVHFCVRRAEGILVRKGRRRRECTMIYHVLCTIVPQCTIYKIHCFVHWALGGLVLHYCTDIARLYYIVVQILHFYWGGGG